MWVACACNMSRHVTQRLIKRGFCTGIPRFYRRSIRALAVLTGNASRALRTLRSDFALRALRALCTLWASRASVALCTLRAGRTGLALNALRAGVTFCTFFALRTL